MTFRHFAFSRRIAVGLLAAAAIPTLALAVGAETGAAPQSGKTGPTPAAPRAEAPKAEVKKPAEPARLDVGPAAAEIKKPDAAVPTPAVPTPTAPAPAGPQPAVAAPTPAPAGAVVLKYKHEVNQVTYYEVDHNVEIMTQKAQSKQSAQNNSRTVKHYRVISVDEKGEALLELFIDKVKMSAKNDEGDEIAYDSDSKDDPPAQFENVRQAIGKPLARITVSPWGEIKSMIRLNGAAGAASDPNDAEAGNNFLIVLPNRPIQPGEGWADKAEVRVQLGQGLNQNVTILRNYELKGVKGGIATISVVSTVLTPVRDPKIEGQLIQRTPSGTIEFDLEKGAIVSRTLKLDKTVIGVFAENSSMRVVSDKVEKLVPRDKVLRTADGGAGPAKN